MTMPTPSSPGDFTARIGLAPGRGISYQIDTDEGGVLVVRSDGTNPTLVLASLEAWHKEVGMAIAAYRAKWRDMIPAISAQTHTIEVDEEVHDFLRLKEKENISPNRALRYLLFGEVPYDDPQKVRDLEKSQQTLNEAREELGE